MTTKLEIGDIVTDKYGETGIIDALPGELISTDAYDLAIIEDNHYGVNYGYDMRVVSIALIEKCAQAVNIKHFY